MQIFDLLKGEGLSFLSGLTRRMNISTLDEGNIYEKIWLPFIYPNTQEWFVIILQVISFLGALAGKNIRDEYSLQKSAILSSLMG